MNSNLPDDPTIYREIIDFIVRNQIYCPRPIPWVKTFEAVWRAEQYRRRQPRLPYREMGLLGPLILNGWMAFDGTKRERFLHHITWARENGHIALLYRQIKDFSEEDYLIDRPLGDRWSPLDIDLQSHETAQ